MKMNNKAGFSLVELMVVVAIIGILATIAVPNFTKFQASARVSANKAEMSSVFTSLVSNNAETGAFDVVNVAGTPTAFGSVAGGSTGVATALGIQWTSAADRYYRTGVTTALESLNTNKCATAPGASGSLSATNFTISSIGCPRVRGTQHTMTVTDTKVWTVPAI